MTTEKVVQDTQNPQVTIQEQTLEEFLAQETPQEKALEEVLTKAFGTFEFGEEEGCSCHTEDKKD